MADAPSERPPLDQFYWGGVDRPEDGILYLYTSRDAGFWKIDYDEDMAIEEATGYPVGELVDHERVGDYEDAESGEVIALFVGEDRSQAGGADGVSLPQTSPEYPEMIADPICVACGKTMGEVCVCYGCRQRVAGLPDDDIESEMVKSYTRGRAAEYWNRQQSIQTDTDDPEVRE